MLAKGLALCYIRIINRKGALRAHLVRKCTDSLIW